MNKERVSHKKGHFFLHFSLFCTFKHKTRTAPKNSPCFSIRVRQYHLSYFYALYVVDFAVLLDKELTVLNAFGGIGSILLNVLNSRPNGGVEGYVDATTVGVRSVEYDYAILSYQ